MARILYIGEDAVLSERLRVSCSGEPAEWNSIGWDQWPQFAGGISEPNVLLLDLVRRTPSTLPVVLVSTHGFRRLLLLSARGMRSRSVIQALAVPTVDFLLAPPKLQEVPVRIQRLLNQAPESMSEGDRTPGFSHVVRELHDPASGRLDAKRISTLFGLPLAEVARLLGREAAAVHKTPDALSLQAPLTLFERIAAPLRHLSGSSENGRIWLNAANPDLAGETPLAYLRAGKGEVVAELLEDALHGQPG